MRKIGSDGLTGRFCKFAKFAIFALSLACLAGFGGLGLATVHADDSCDSSEQVACIPIPTDATPQPGGASNSVGATAPSAAAVAVPGGLCAQGACCPLPAVGAQTPNAAAVAVPSPIGNCPPYPCPPPLLPGAAIPGAAAAAAPIVAGPLPQPTYCSPYRGIYTTINLGNAADVRALRTLSTSALRPYWRGNAFSTIASQINQLQAVGDYATPSLQSIQVQSATVDLLSSTASVRTLEHWLYQERSLYDGSLVASQDQWVTNSYTLSSTANGWYITDDQISQTPGPYFP